MSMNMPVTRQAVVDCTPSLTNSKMVLDSEITEGQSVKMEIQAFDDEGFDINEARGRFFEVVAQKMPSGKILRKRSQFKEKLFVVLFDNDDLGSVGTYSIYIHGWNDGHSKTTKFEVVANSSDALTLPTESRPHILKVKSSKVKKIIAGAVAVVMGVSLGTAFVYARRNPGITQTSASLQSDSAAVLCIIFVACTTSHICLLLCQEKLVPF